MIYLNKITIIGNLTKEPELKALPSGTKVVNFSVATNRTWKDAQGIKQEDVEFHNVIVFGKQAETVKQYFNKGDQIFIEGRLQTRSWEVEGKKNYRTEIVLESFQFGNKNTVKANTETTKKTFTPEEKETMSVDDIASLSEVAFQEMSESNPF